MTVPQPGKASILIVDDEPSNLLILDQLLRPAHTVHPATDGATALRIAAAEARPDLILLDINMPGMDGYEVLTRLKADERTRDIPVIFVTAMTGSEAEIRGLDSGAEDYIAKPYSPAIVLARVHTHLALQQARRRIAEQNALLVQEHVLLGRIIDRMRTEADFADRHLRYSLTAADGTLGDMLFSAFTPDGRQWLLVGDVAGHGPAAAVCVPLLSYVFYRSARIGGDIEPVLQELNTVMHRQLPAEIFLVYCLAEVSADRRMLRLWNGGLPGSLRVGAEGVVERFPSLGLPLGVSARIPAGDECQTLALREGDRIYLFTDGLTEVADREGNFFGADQLARSLAALSADGDLAEVLAQLAEFHGGSNFADDITLVELRP